MGPKALAALYSHPIDVGLSRLFVEPAACGTQFLTTSAKVAVSSVSVLSSARK